MRIRVYVFAFSRGAEQRDGARTEDAVELDQVCVVAGGEGGL